MNIAVTNRKGGVGKSTWTVHIAAALAIKGKRVCIVDSDVQGHAALLLGLPTMNGLYHAMILRDPLTDLVMEVPPANYSAPDMPPLGALYVLPSAELTSKIEKALAPDDIFAFVRLTQELTTTFDLDVVIIDTHPTLSDIDGVIWLAVDGFIYVTECSRLALLGVKNAIDQLESFASDRMHFMGRDTHIIGIIPNKMHVKTKVQRNNIMHLGTQFPDKVWPLVPYKIAWEEAANEATTIFNWSPTGPEAAIAWEIATKTEEALEWLPKEP